MPSPPSLFWLVNRKEGQPGSFLGSCPPCFSLLSDLPGCQSHDPRAPVLPMADIQAAFVPLLSSQVISWAGQVGLCLSSLRSKLRTRHLAGDRGNTGLSREPHRFKCRTADSALTSNSCLPAFWAPGWTGNTFRLQCSAAQTNASYPKRLLWLGTRFTVRSWVDNQHCYFKALRTASSFMTTARSPFTFSRPLM